MKRRFAPAAASRWPARLLAVSVGTAICTLATSLPLADAESEASRERRGWDDETVSELISGCVDGFMKRVLKVARKQAGIADDEPLPDEADALVTQVRESTEKTCRCVADRVIEKQTYEEYARDQSLGIREAQAVDTPGGCPFEFDEAS